MMPSPSRCRAGADMDWARILTYVTGTVDQDLLARNEYLAAENRILKVQLNGRLKLSDAERSVLGEIGHRLGLTGHYPGLVPRACRPKIRWLEGPSRSGQASDQARGRTADHSRGQREPRLACVSNRFGCPCSKVQ
jgi:hypothetical protein